ncbi:MAG: D-isomer specific 2-hydroxyacid dehydrogenase family protein [Lachnospiraceae bacterium]|nr:D-isomer specific 2-hydroxyacid dehydrogenase family protein [Lachnospiraceae bacterium]
MKIAAYNYRDFDEARYFEKFASVYGVEIVPIRETPSPENAGMACGCEGVSVITTPITGDIIRAWKEAGVKHISTRTIGYDHVDLEEAKKQGMAVSNVTYSTGSVADYTVMLILMALRRMKSIIKRAEGMDYSLNGNIGREIGSLTVGVVGTGKIGTHVIRNLSGFGCRIIAYDLYENDTVKQYASYCTLEELFAESDVITFHTPATPSSYHMVNAETIRTMKDGVIIVNTARGSIIDTPAFIEALEQGKIGGAALDVIENELGIFYGDYKYQVIGHREMSILKDLPNVLMLPHMAFYTENSVSDMVEHSISHIVNGDGNVVPGSGK